MDKKGLWCVCRARIWKRVVNVRVHSKLADMGESRGTLLMQKLKEKSPWQHPKQGMSIGACCLLEETEHPFLFGQFPGALNQRRM